MLIVSSGDLEVLKKKERNKAIDDFMKKIAEKFGESDEVVIEHFILKKLAEQMKGV